MPKTADPSGHFRSEKPCKRCGTFWRHADQTCVECTRLRNAKKYAKRKRTRSQAIEEAPVKQTPRKDSEISLGFKISSYHNSVPAIERSRYLDRLIRVRSGLEDEQGSPRVVTAGDLHRASLPVGGKSRDTSADYPKLAGARHAQNDALAAAIEKVRSTLPDLVTVDDVMDAVPREVIEPIMVSRRRYAASSAMAQIGIVKVHPGQRGRHRFFAVRDLPRYQAMRAVDLVALHAKMNGLPPPPPPLEPGLTRKMALAAGAYTYQREIPCPRCGGHEYTTANCRCTTCPPPVTLRMGSEPRAAAKAGGEATYVGMACQRCGGTLRWTSNYGCVECTAARRASRPGGVAPRVAALAAAGEARAAALAAGEKTYLGFPCRRCGENLRRTPNHRCIACERAGHGRSRTRREQAARTATRMAAERAAGPGSQDTGQPQGVNGDEGRRAA